MSPLASYRRLYELAGPAYVVVAFLGRLPLSMSQLGTLLLVSAATGSYATGGLAAGVLAVANAVGAPVAGAVADRVGQRPVVLAQSLAGAATLGLLVHAAGRDGVPSGALVLAAALAGACIPQVGPLARARWRPLVGRGHPHRRRLLDTAFSYEGAMDEASFVLGPALVGVLVALASPAVAMGTAAVLLVVVGTAFALHPSARLTGAGDREGARPGGAARERFLTPFFVVLLVALLCVGALFGATQTGTTVLADSVGQPGLAGLVHAVLGVGSVVAGFGTALLPAGFVQERRMLASASLLLLLSLPLLAVDSLGGLVLVVLALGFAVAPYLISVFSLGERALPPGRSSLGLSLLGSAVGIGYAVGAGLAGRLADALGDGRGHTAAFAVTVSATAVAIALAASLQRPARRLAAAASAAEPAHPLLDVV
ncbi:MFS transporter [Nocardioides solisilvae]|uniref:MFS transporter n=1 Tax=Nocardioides solisilvae TaxID=1542435 RepID=UPI000D747F16|nr:MFS transporter [Nocardioides solisilvae]